VSDGPDRRPDESLRLRYSRLSGSTRRLLATEGESGRFEFKQDDTVVTAGVIAAAANASELEGVGAVTILVGVEEIEDLATSVVRGRVLGLADVEKARSRITSRAASVKPVPPHLTVVEENTGTAKPILRLEISPTRAPHYTDTGNRATRYGASTRAITDEELLELYLFRDAEAFELRFRRIAERLQEELRRVGGDVTELVRSLERHESTD
jgi:predicted HTH transcriptional regulator